MSNELIGLIVVGLLVLRVAWRLSDVREDVRLLRLQMNRLTFAPPTLEDRVRLERDADIDELRAEDHLAIARADGAKIQHEERVGALLMSLRSPPTSADQRVLKKA